MLLLAQSERETIILETSDGPIEVRLSQLGGSNARIGIDAPKSVRIIRREVLATGPAVTQAETTVPAVDDPWWFHPDDASGVLLDGDPVMRARDWDDDTLD